MTDSVVFETLAAGNGQSIGVATLNVEKKLNSLNQDMVALLTEQFTHWQQDDKIACVWLQGAGEKAFCAGGDVKCLRDRIDAVGPKDALPYVQAFFENEYRLDYLIHRYAKPIICWGHGIVMGGGIGLMSGASHRVVTETSRMAMPEITIGLYPDVGGTWFLNHAPGRTGLFLGLTGANFNAADALFVGMADRFVPSAQKAAVLAALQQQEWSQSAVENSARVSAVLREFEALSQLPAGNVRKHYDLIQAVTDGDTTAQVVHNILAIESEEKWLQKAVATLKAGCPTTAHLVFEQLRRGKKLSLEGVFQMELVMSLQCSLHPDFPEGVRALLVDKDGAPKWQHESVDAVSAQWIAEHFEMPWAQGGNPLADLS
ncbi:enoyl-CoA hydratase/isomerase family protein [Ketobacter sp.]|uniref:enoyl-CoA hydratase/isomerase family protein n=1 Tax=Ketobacter sp. TaxID=2083498 RepID=UPI000F23BB4A|nr:enoyl-CoA hydratase/isomerase family protein [Ketobacter sp.]RLT94461.1 MAG: enoyl-CoA hydratase/isomerase family protein [Ketobacter sp.]